jgi:hypothetical protein
VTDPFKSAGLIPLVCPACLNGGHVCENHPDRPWAGVANDPRACDCGAGVPCPVCCDPVPMDGTLSIAEAFTPRHLRTAPVTVDASTDLLSQAEHRAMDLTGELVKLVTAEIVADGPTRIGDLSEFMANIHGIQNMILAQAAGRAYPDRYRLLGGTAGT